MRRIGLTGSRDFCQTRQFVKRIRIRRRIFPLLRFFASFGNPAIQNQPSGGKKGIPMNQPIRLKTTTPPLLITLALLCFGLLPRAEAVVPAPDGGYPGHNTAEGQSALFSLTTGEFNTAVGYVSLGENTTGGFNTANGYAALRSNTTGDHNTATGAGALTFNTTGQRNTADGVSALFFNDTGHHNTALGQRAGSNQTTGSNNVYIGAGMSGVAGESNACYIKSIFMQTSASGIPVLIDSNNKLGTTTSSKRFKEDIKPMGNASEAILALRPVSFRYKKDIDPLGIPEFGLVAEEVEKVNPALVIRDPEGRPYTVRYEQVNAMLLNEFLKEHRTVDELKAMVAQQQKQIEALTAGLQKVSAQLELNRTAPQTVLNDN